jgi:hypothetical protein
VDAQGFVSKNDRLGKPDRKPINERRRSARGNLIPLAANEAGPSLVRHFTAGLSRLYQPISAILASFVPVVRVPKEKNYSKTTLDRLVELR